MKREQILTKAQKYLIKYSNSSSKYYEELKKAYNEYKELDNSDPVINKLYSKQINKLCMYVEESENFVSFLIRVIFSFFDQRPHQRCDFFLFLSGYDISTPITSACTSLTHYR